MDFDVRKPRHLAALFLVGISLFLLVVLPVWQFFEPFPLSSANQDYSGVTGIILEIYILIFSLFIVFVLMVLIPLLWYLLVNRLQLFESLHRMNLHAQGIGMALLWGFVTAVLALVISVIIEIVITGLGVNTTDLSNIPQLEQLYPLPVLLVIVVVQPIAEEIFFRGFLLEKVSGFAGPIVGVMVSAVLFGMAHLSYGMAFTAVIAGGLGLLFGIAVVRTKNLYTAIFAHILVNAASITLYLFGQSTGI